MKKITFLILIMSGLSISQERGYIQINSNDVVHYIITDPQSRKTGRDPRGVEKKIDYKRIKEIPGANYGFMSVGDIPGPGEEFHEDISHEFVFAPDSSQADGLYTIELIGIKSGNYDISISISPVNKESIDLHDQGGILKNQVVIFNFFYSDNPSDSVFIKKVASSHNVQLKESQDSLLNDGSLK